MRPISSGECVVLKHLLEAAGIKLDASLIAVSSMDDGGMGSLHLMSDDPGRRFGSRVAECEFNDRDGVLVSATLNVDREGELFEMDVWKVDFAPLQRWPTPDEIRPAPAV